jgi:hypothetical protein
MGASRPQPPAHTFSITERAKAIRALKAERDARLAPAPDALGGDRLLPDHSTLVAGEEDDGEGNEGPDDEAVRALDAAVPLHADEVLEPHLRPASPEPDRPVERDEADNVSATLQAAKSFFRSLPADRAPSLQDVRGAASRAADARAAVEDATANALPRRT